MLRRTERMGRRQVAGVLAALAPLAFLGIGQVDAQFTDTAAASKVTIGSGQVPAPVVRCTQSGSLGLRDVVLRWDPAAAGGPYTYRIVLQRGSTVTEQSLGNALTWDVPGGSFSTQNFSATVYATKGSWTSAASNVETYAVYLLDEYCT